MKIVFYRDKETNRIVNFHLPPPKFTGNKLDDAIKKYNTNETNSSIAEVVEADEYMKYLYKKSIEKQLYPKQLINDALDALNNAVDCINALEVRNNNVQS